MSAFHSIFNYISCHTATDISIEFSLSHTHTVWLKNFFVFSFVCWWIIFSTQKIRRIINKRVICTFKWANGVRERAHAHCVCVCERADGQEGGRDNFKFRWRIYNLRFHVQIFCCILLVCLFVWCAVLCCIVLWNARGALMLIYVDSFQEIFLTEITAVAFNHINHLLVAVRCVCVCECVCFFLLSSICWLLLTVFTCYLCAYLSYC